MLAKYKTDDGFGLGIWVNKQREKKDTIEPHRRQLLEALPGWSWGPYSDKWEKGLSYLKEFSGLEGHCRVAISYKTNDGYRLGQWVAVQRTTEDKIDPDRRQRLEELPGWSWDALSDKWEEGFSHLKDFCNRAGHCRVVQGYKTDDGFRLGTWVAKQRGKKDTIEPDRRQRLEALPGWTWDPHSNQWDKGFSHLEQFSSERKGHCRVPNDFTTDDGYRLGQWVAIQRRTKDALEPVRRQRLEALPGWSWDVLADKWEDGFSYLKKLSDREGHCQVTMDYRTDDGYRLGQWVKVQRRNRDTMDPDRRQRLEELPGWSWSGRTGKNRARA
jgi:hypothetical protein